MMAARTLLLKYLSFFIVCFLVGCSLSEATHPIPQVNIPQQWSSNHAHFQMNQVTNLPELAWWQEYHSPELNTLIQEALQKSNDIHIAAANLEYAQSQLKQIQLNWIPGMSVMGGYSQMPNLGDPGYFFGFMPLYALNVFQQIKQQQTAEYQLEASQYAQDSVRLAVIGQVAASYFSILAQNELLEFYNNLLNHNQRLLALYQSQYRAGIISQDKINETQQTLKQIQAQITIIHYNRVVSKNALRFLSDRNPGNIILKTPFNAINSNKIIPGNSPITVLNNRPDIREAQASLKAANTNIGATATQLLPAVRLDTFLGDSSLQGNTPLNEAYLKVPVIQPNIIGDIKVSQAQYKILYATYIKTVRLALHDVENDLSAYTEYSAQLHNNIDALAQKKQQCHLVDSRYRHGIDSEVEVMQCRIDIDKIQLTLNQNKLEKMMTIVALYQDLAGGYRGA